jgi:hypothetical protein
MVTTKAEGEGIEYVGKMQVFKCICFLQSIYMYSNLIRYKVGAEKLQTRSFRHPVSQGSDMSGRRTSHYATVGM